MESKNLLDRPKISPLRYCFGRDDRCSVPMFLYRIFERGDFFLVGVVADFII